jgi:predicted house-cleaning noncanonical NTP pyrophosphatase (MazG superfamily)
MTNHHKLVRDRIPETIARSGTKANFRKIGSDQEYVDELTKKLIEEAREVRESPSVEELADLKEVFEALLKVLGISQEDIGQVQDEKAKKNGRFNDRLFLIDTEDLK